MSRLRLFAPKVAIAFANVARIFKYTFLQLFQKKSPANLSIVHFQPHHPLDISFETVASSQF